MGTQERVKLIWTIAMIVLAFPVSSPAQITFERTYGGSLLDIGNSVQQTSDGGYIITGQTQSFGAGSSDFYLIKTDADGLVVSVGEDEGLPIAYSLSQNYPNPFNPSTTIKYRIPELNFVSLKVYDVLGSEVATLVNEEKPIGSYEVELNASLLPSGTYFYKLQAGSFVETKKMVLLR